MEIWKWQKNRWDLQSGIGEEENLCLLGVEEWQLRSSDARGH